MDQDGEQSPGHPVSQPTLTLGSEEPPLGTREEESSGISLRNATAPRTVLHRTPSLGIDGIAPVAPAQAHAATGAIPVAGGYEPKRGD